MQKLFNILTVASFLITMESCDHSSAKGKMSKEDSLIAGINQINKQIDDALSHRVLTKSMIQSESDSTLEELINSNIYFNIPAYTDEDYKKSFLKNCAAADFLFNISA